MVALLRVAPPSRRAVPPPCLDSCFWQRVEDYTGNIPFVVISRTSTDSWIKHTLVSLPDGPGSLYHVLGFFAAREINLTRIESRPARRSLGDWLFFIDCEGHRSDPVLVALWDELRRSVPFLKLLGSYPTGKKCLTADKLIR